MKPLLLLISTFLLLVGNDLSSESRYGVGISFLSSPLYIGSSVQNSYVSPIPYIDYQGEYFKINRDKIYNEFYDTDSFKIELSMRAMLPSIDGDKGARVDMPDLDFAIDIGPNFIYHIYNYDQTTFSLEVPIRAMFSSDSDLRYQGYLSNINLHYKTFFSGYKFEYTTGLVWGDKNYHNYYYEIDKQYATTQREEYHANSGYGGWQNSLSFTKTQDNFWYGMFIKHYSLNGVVYEDSPLVEQNNALFYGTAISYIF